MLKDGNLLLGIEEPVVQLSVLSLIDEFTDSLDKSGRRTYHALTKAKLIDHNSRCSRLDLVVVIINLLFDRLKWYDLDLIDPLLAGSLRCHLRPIFAIANCQSHPLLAQVINNTLQCGRHLTECVFDVVAAFIKE